ncbi:MAG: carboxypeptidase-like regulatory domain-containing protein, partial [Elusimicrobiota bacterium]|nr:carboxypeptidase-like regulatory domain-containing protein [Elusimicrobiota bacterium]
RATVSGGVGSINLKFKRYSGRLTTKFIVPGNDYDNLQISLNGPNLWLTSQSIAQIVAAGRSFDSATGILTTPPLGTGFYQIKGLYTGSALEKTKSAMAVNGETRDAGTIDLTATTYSISGRVKINPSNPLKEPYDNVSIIVSTINPTNTNAWTYPNIYYIPPDYLISTTSFRVSVYEYKNYQSRSGLSGGSDTSSKNGMIQQDGTYQINGLTPGVYVLKIPALNLDGNSGNEIPSHEKQVMVTGNTTNSDIELSDGYSVKGRLKLPDGSAAVTRDFDIYVFDAAKYGYGSWTAPAGYVTCSFNNATSADYEIKHLLPGDYIVSVQDWGYWDNTLSQWFPQQYANTALKVEIKSSDLNGQDLQLSKGGTIKYKLKDADSGTVITPSNKSKMLPSSYAMYSAANPWVEGGYGSLATVSGTAAQSDYFEMQYLPKATYDLHLGQSEYGYMGFSSISGGSSDMGGNNASYAAKTVNSIKVENDQTTDIGTVEIKQGLSVSGTVTDSSGKGIPNVPVVAAPSLTNDFSSELRGFTDINGKYTIVGIDPEITYYDIIACPRIDLSDFGGYFFFGSGGLAFGEKVKSMVKIATTGSVDFVL